MKLVSKEKYQSSCRTEAVGIRVSGLLVGNNTHYRQIVVREQKRINISTEEIGDCGLRRKSATVSAQKAKTVNLAGVEKA